MPTSLTVDAPDQVVGTVLQQFVNSTWEPLAFFSKKLRQPEKKYSTFDWELLVLYLGVRHFCYFLEGQQFIANTDHKPLTFCMSMVSEPWFNCQQRQLSNMYISEYNTDTRHLQGKDNFFADTLYRATINSMQLGINYADMAEAQQQDPEVQAYCTGNTSLQLEDVHFESQGIILLCDVSTDHAWPIVPAT